MEIDFGIASVSFEAEQFPAVCILLGFGAIFVTSEYRIMDSETLIVRQATISTGHLVGLLLILIGIYWIWIERRS